jgi:hypothetical protein
MWEGKGKRPHHWREDWSGCGRPLGRSWGIGADRRPKGTRSSAKMEGREKTPKTRSGAKMWTAANRSLGSWPRQQSPAR